MVIGQKSFVIGERHSEAGFSQCPMTADISHYLRNSQI